MDICILIPTINRKDLLDEALEEYAKCYPTIDKFIVDNGKQNIKCLDDNTWIFEQETNLGVAGSWNYLIKKAIEKGYEYFLILNDDVILKKDKEWLEKIINRGNPHDFVLCRPFYNLSSFILNKTIYHKVGEFDEGFIGSYFEDNDYMYRMKLAGCTIRYDDDLNPDIYRNSMTIQKDPLLGNYINNREYFIKKWGGLPTEELFKIPFKNSL
jgi:GT2 family glycosyltransferase